MSSAGHIYDQARLLDEYHGDEELLRRVIDAFDREYRDRMQRLRKAITAGDQWTFNRESHAFKGSVAIFFARSAFDAAVAMENDRDLSQAFA